MFDNTILTDKSKKELIALCSELGIQKCSSKTKNELIGLIHFREACKNIVSFDPPFISLAEKVDTGDAPLFISLAEKVDNENVVLNVGQAEAAKEEYPLEREQPYMASFLDSIRSTSGSGGGFKRIIASPLRYAGGKSKAVGLILGELPKLKHKRIVSPFFGGGSFELCVSQSLGIEVIGYDIFEMLTNFWDVLINRRDEFVKELKKFEINETEFTRNRHILLAYWDKVKPATLVYKTKQKMDLSSEEMTRLDGDKLMQAVYYYYNMTLSYGPMFLGWPSSNEIKKEKFDRRIEKLGSLQLKGLKVSCCDFKTAILNHPDDFLFLDPPYYLGQDSKMFKGMYPNCNFAIHHNAFEHDVLCELLKNHKGGFLLTYNNCETIRTMYAGFKQTFPEWQYTYGQGETRIGKNRTNSNIKESHEIFIICNPTLFTTS